jgi:hypothetical protein
MPCYAVPVGPSFLTSHLRLKRDIDNLLHQPLALHTDVVLPSSAVFRLLWGQPYQPYAVRRKATGIPWNFSSIVYITSLPCLSRRRQTVAPFRSSNFHLVVFKVFNFQPSHSILHTHDLVSKN